MVGVVWSKYLSSMATVVFLMSSCIPIIGRQRPWPRELPEELLQLDMADRIHTDPVSTAAVASDFGMLLTNQTPAAVLRPSSDEDIASVVRLSYTSARPFPIAARGNGHSIWGQAFAPGGVVVDMRSIADRAGGGGPRITVRLPEGRSNGTSSSDVLMPPPPPYVDAGGEQLWVDVLHESVKHGLSPRSWTDYLHLTVGGTLSNAGVSGQAFRHGPQISNVLELDVITGRGEKLTCSEVHNPNLFHAVLGGLGQFGIITRARIALDPAPQRVRWVKLVYTDFTNFTGDQEYLLSLGVDGGRGRGGGERRRRGFDYVEGSLFVEQSPMNSWRSSFFSAADLKRINSLTGGNDDGERRPLYILEGTMYYNDSAAVDKEMEGLMRELRFERGFAFKNDVAYVEFLDRVHVEEKKLRAKGQWHVPHPWLNVFIPSSGIANVDQDVFKRILLRPPHRSVGPILIFPLNKTMWDERTSAVIPESEVFYLLGLLRSATDDGGSNSWQRLEEQNQEILRFFADAGIEVKQYIPRHKTRGEWEKHFGRRRWDLFLQRKAMYDPKAILSPGQRIFSLGDAI